MKPGSPSFFDVEGCSNLKTIWEVLSSDEDIYFQERVMKLARDGQSRKPLELGLSMSYLLKIKDQNPQVQIGLVLTKLELIPEEFGFRLIRNQQVLQFYVASRDDYVRWRDTLTKRCFQSTFHEEFSVTKLIGKGSFAKVYLAAKKENNQPYAIKAFNKEFMLEQFKGKESLQNEIQVMRRLHHENLVQLYEVYETQNSIYFIIDLIKGGELLNRVKQKGQLSSGDLQRLMHNLMRGLAHIHSKNCLHRDLKPENLLLRTKDSDHDIVIADFGLATFLDGEILFKRCGTPGFVAPEILLYKDNVPFYDSKCDVFSAGIIFYLLLTGKQPFQGKDFKEILKANKSCDINFFLPQIINAPQSLQKLLQKMLNPNPTNRISSAEEQLMDEQTQENLGMYEKDFLYGLQFKKGLDSQIGSMELQQRLPCQNGKVDTIGSLSTYSNSSITKFEQPKLVQSKFSQFSMKGSQKNISIQQQQPMESQSPANRRNYNDCSSPSSRQRMQIQTDLHKKAIINSYSKQKYEEYKRTDTEDTFQDENPQFQKALSIMSTQGEPKFIKSKSQSRGSSVDSPKSAQEKQQERIIENQ